MFELLVQVLLSVCMLMMMAQMAVAQTRDDANPWMDDRARKCNYLQAHTTTGS